MRTVSHSDSPRMQELSPYQIHSRREIISILRSLQQQRQFITMLVNGAPEAVITTVLEVDEEQNLVYLDCASNETMNRRIVEGDNISFETVLDHIRILFFTSDIRECTHDDLPALYMPIPANVIRLQRREYYRISTPISNPVRCIIPVQHELGTEAVTFTLKNASGAGIALLDDRRVLDNTIGRVYKDCQILLPGNTIIITSLEIRNSHDITLATGNTMRHIGCLLRDLPPAMLYALQRYITKLEREQNATIIGMLK